MVTKVKNSSSMTSTSQSLEDKLYALKYFLSGKGIPFVVVKATTSELIGPKKKHLSYLVNMTHEPNVSIPNMVKHLMIRARFPDWSVAFKAIITMHHLMAYGNEKFIQNLASSTVDNRSFDRLCSYADRSTILGYNMSIFLRRYSRYINNKIQTYRSLGMDFCRISHPQQQRHKHQDTYYYNYIPAPSAAAPYYVCQDESLESNQNPALQLKTMPPEQLLKVIPIIQAQFDSLLAFDASADDLCNGIINSAFTMLYKDFVKLYIAYQVAIIRLLKLYFSNNVLRKAKEMLELYKKFLVRMDKVSDFLPVVDMVGMDKSDLPNLSRAPNLPLKMLEKHIDLLSKRCHTDSNATTPITGLNRMQSVELPRIEYGTLGRPRRRSLRTPTSSGRQTSIDFLSPMAAINYKRRQQGEIKRLDRMLEMDTSDQEKANRTEALSSSQCKRKKSSDCGQPTTLATVPVEEDDESHRYEDLGGSLLGIESERGTAKEHESNTQFDWFSNYTTTNRLTSEHEEMKRAREVDRLPDSRVVTESRQRDLLILHD